MCAQPDGIRVEELWYSLVGKAVSDLDANMSLDEAAEMLAGAEKHLRDFLRSRKVEELPAMILLVEGIRLKVIVNAIALMVCFEEEEASINAH